MSIFKKIFKNDKSNMEKDQNNSEKNQHNLIANNDFQKLFDEHYSFQETIKNNYMKRENPENLDKTIEACKEQIKIAPEVRRAFLEVYKNAPLPRHIGYEQLAIIEEKQNNYEEVIRLSKMALNENWAGDWHNRIERCEKKLKK